MSLEALHTITKCWTRRFGLFWSGRDAIEVTAEQIAVPNDPTNLLALVKITIKVNGKTTLEQQVPWPMPRGEIMVPLAVYMMAKMPNYEHAIWQPTMERFCWLCPGFQPPTKVWWGKPGEDAFNL